MVEIDVPSRKIVAPKSGLFVSSKTRPLMAWAKVILAKKKHNSKKYFFKVMVLICHKLELFFEGKKMFVSFILYFY